MWRWIILGGLVVVLGACSTPKKERFGVKTSPSQIISSDAFVLVEADQRLFPSPENGKGFSFTVEPKLHSLEGYAPFKIVEDTGEWLKVETIQPQEPSPHCYAPLSAFNRLRLQFYVRKRDVAPVTIRPFVHQIGSTYVKVTSGLVPVSDPGGFVIQHVGFNVLIPLPESAIGKRYTPAEKYPRLNKTMRFVPSDAFGAGKVKLADGTKIDRIYDAWVLRETAVDQNEALVTMGSRCVQVKALVKRESIKDSTVEGFGRIRARGNKPKVRSGQVAYWPSGERAGETMDKVGFSNEAPTQGARRCFEVHLSRNTKARDDLAPHQIMVLCFDKTSIIDD